LGDRDRPPRRRDSRRPELVRLPPSARGEPVDPPGARLGLPPIRRSGDPSSSRPHGTSPRATPTGGGRGSRTKRRVGHVVRTSIRPAASARASWIYCRGKKRTRKTRRRTKSHRAPENGSALSFVIDR